MNIFLMILAGLIALVFLFLWGACIMAGNADEQTTKIFNKHKYGNSDMSERQICTKENPYNKDIDEGRYSHPDAKELGQDDGYPCGDTVYYKCPNCGLRFKCELPQ